MAQILIGASHDQVDYRYGDQITALTQTADGVEVVFAAASQRRFDLVIGADGLHSGVRQLVFGADSGRTTWLGGYLAVASITDQDGPHRDGEMRVIADANRMVAVYHAPTLGDLPDARVLFLFRPPAELDYDHRDATAQRRLLHAAFHGLLGRRDRGL